MGVGLPNANWLPHVAEKNVAQVFEDGLHVPLTVITASEEQIKAAIAATNEMIGELVKINTTILACSAAIVSSLDLATEVDTKLKHAREYVLKLECLLKLRVKVARYASALAAVKIVQAFVEKLKIELDTDIQALVVSNPHNGATPITPESAATSVTDAEINALALLAELLGSLTPQQ